MQHCGLYELYKLRLILALFPINTKYKYLQTNTARQKQAVFLFYFIITGSVLTLSLFL